MSLWGPKIKKAASGTLARKTCRKTWVGKNIMSTTALRGKHERDGTTLKEGLSSQEHANRVGGKDPDSNEKATRKIYINRIEFRIRFDNSQLIPSPRMKGAHLGPVLPHGFSYEY